MTVQERARALRRDGALLREIAEEFSVSVTTAHKWVGRAREYGMTGRYRLRACVDCGAGVRATRCHDCSNVHRRAVRSSLAGDLALCRACQEWLPAASFSLRPETRRGLRALCRNCESQAAMQRQRAEPEKKAARMAVYFAVRAGKLERQPCEVCGDTDAEAHHDDYARKLDVRWLCPLHHTAEHDVA